MLDRYGRTALVVGVTIVAVAAVALIVARRRRRPTLGDRIMSASSRLEGPITSIRAAAGRISR
jgi:MYXO-CTERM domain-containing protein